jgi:hypothetical protein
MDDFEAQLRRATKLRISLVSRLTVCANGGCPYSDETIPVLEYHIRIVDCTDLVAASAMSHARVVSERVRATARATVSAAAGAAALAQELNSSGELSFMYRYILRESCSQFDSLPLTSLMG